VGVTNPDDTWSECEIGPGEVSFIPMGYFHYIEALGGEELVIAVVFNHEMPEDIGLSTCFAGTPTKIFSDAMGASMGGFTKPNKTLFLVPPL
jgi:oxalate decarboxylase